MIKFEYFDEGKLLITKYIGEIDKETLKSYIKYIFEKSGCAKLEKLILDYREAILLFNPGALKEIAVTRKAVDVGRIKNHSVFLVDKPRETALILMISMMYNRDLNPADFCSTLKGCIEALSIDLKVDDLDRRLKELKFEFVG
jgi:hypothetical protein